MPLADQSSYTESRQLQSGLAAKALKERRRLLIVIDSTLKFDHTDSPDAMCLSRFIEVLRSEFTVDTQQYCAADQSGFRFSHLDTMPAEHRYSAILLFGFARKDSAYSDFKHLTDKDLKSLKEFMEGPGHGGIFATGDHLNVGEFLGGDIPRVRHMRLWSHNFHAKNPRTLPTYMASSDVSTLWPRAGGRVDSTLEHDGIPQTIFPDYFWAGTLFVPTDPHPLLQAPGNRVINVMPDHPHEGRCRLPTADELSGKHKNDETLDWPAGAEKHVKIVAKGMSGRNHYEVLNGATALVAPPSEYPCIVAYDGKPLNQGRIVTQSSFHHFLDMNTDGLVEKNPTAWGLVRQYYLNLAEWLCEGATTGPDISDLTWRKLLGTYPMIETLPPEVLFEQQDKSLDHLLEVQIIEALHSVLPAFRVASILGSIQDVPAHRVPTMGEFAIRTAFTAPTTSLMTALRTTVNRLETTRLAVPPV